MLAKSKYTILSATVLMFALFSSPSMAGSPTACCGSCSFHSNIHNSIESILIGTSTSP